MVTESRDIITLGMAADEARRKRHGRRATFVRVAEVPAEPGAAVTVPAPAGEVRITGTPASIQAAMARTTEVVSRAGEVPVTGFSLADLETLAGREGVTLRRLLEDLRAAGLELIADAPFDALQNPQRSIEEVNIAGLGLARLTIHDTPSGDVESLFGRISALQQVVGVVRAFAPLPRRLNPAAPSTGYQDVTHLAQARLIVQNVLSIQIDWSLYGPKLAQVALTVGADDVDGVSPIDDLSEGRRRAPLEEIRRNIAAAGLEAVERNGRFETLSR